MATSFSQTPLDENVILMSTEPGQKISNTSMQPCKKVVEDEATRLMREEIRQEIRREMEEKAREEQAAREAERQLQELQEKIKISEICQTKIIQEQYPAIQPFLQQLIFADHNILVIKRSVLWISRCKEQNAIIITNKAVYMLCNMANNKQKYLNKLSPIYSFNYPLNLKQTRLIANLALVDIKLEEYDYTFPIIINCPKQFEAVIRYIPGSYINGPWKQLDGFFGTYINESTMELSSLPPPM